jgi:hypothetical protein
MKKIKYRNYMKKTSNVGKMTIVTITGFLLSSVVVFAHEGEAGITVVSEADWIGPLVAVLIIVVTVVIAKVIKKS